MKRRSSSIPALLIIAAIWGGAAHAQSAPAEGQSEVTFRPWIGTLGVRFHSESLFEETAYAPFPGELRERGAASELSGRAGAASLQRLGLGGEWRPFRNRFRLNFAMYLDPVETDDVPGIFRTRKLAETGSASGDLVPLGDFEAVSYVGLGWRTNADGLDVNLDVGAFLSEESFPRGELCPGSGATLSGCGAAPFGNGRGKLDGSFRKFEWYPVVSLGIEYRF